MPYTSRRHRSPKLAFPHGFGSEGEVDVFDIVLGCLLVALALGFNAALVLWSCRIIHQIAEKGPGPYHKILKDLRDGG